jgi:probable addiction module antidote protein
MMSAYDDLGITGFDAAAYLDTDEAQIAYLNDAVASGDPGVLASALGAVARAKSRTRGMGELARATGIKRQTLNKSLGPKGNPSLTTLVPVVEKLGLGLRFVSLHKGRRRRARGSTTPAAAQR